MEKVIEFNGLDSLKEAHEILGEGMHTLLISREALSSLVPNPALNEIGIKSIKVYMQSREDEFIGYKWQRCDSLDDCLAVAYNEKDTVKIVKEK